MAFEFTFADALGYYDPTSSLFSDTMSAEALCRSVGLTDDAAGDEETNSEATAASDYSQASSSATSPTLSTASAESPVAIWDHRHARGKPAAAKARPRAPTADKTPTPRREVSDGSKIAGFAKNIYDKKTNKNLLHRYSGFDQNTTFAVHDAITSGSVPFSICAERLGAVIRNVVCTSLVPGRPNYTQPLTNTDVDFVPFFATEHLADNTPAEHFALRPQACVAVLFVPFAGQIYVACLFRENGGFCAVTGGDGDATVALQVSELAVVWANRAGWPEFVASEVQPVLPLGPSSGFEFDYSALLAYWTVALTYGGHAESNVRRFLRAMQEMRDRLDDPETGATIADNMIGSLVAVLITSRFLLSRPMVMRNFVPFEL